MVHLMDFFPPATTPRTFYHVNNLTLLGKIKYCNNIVDKIRNIGKCTECEGQKRCLIHKPSSRSCGASYENLNNFITIYPN